MLRGVLAGLFVLLGAACGLPLNGLGDAPPGDQGPNPHGTSPGSAPVTQADAGSGATSNDAGTLVPEASGAESGAQQDAADDSGDGNDADGADADGGTGGGGDQGGKNDGGKGGGDLRFGAY